MGNLLNKSLFDGLEQVDVAYSVQFHQPLSAAADPQPGRGMPGFSQRARIVAALRLAWANEPMRRIASGRRRQDRDAQVVRFERRLPVSNGKQ